MKTILYQLTTPLVTCGAGKPIAALCTERSLAINGTLDAYERFNHDFGSELIAWRLQLTVMQSGGDGEYPQTVVALCAHHKGKSPAIVAFPDLVPGMNEQSHLTVLLHGLQEALAQELVTA